MFNTTFRKIALIVVLSLTVFFTFSYAGYIITLTLPLLIALVISYKIRPLIKYLDKHTPLPMGIISLLSVLFTLCIISLLVWAIAKGISSASHLVIAILPNAIIELNIFYQSAIESYNSYFSLIPRDWQGLASNSINSLTSNIGSLLASTGTHVVSSLSFLPNILFFLVFTLLTSYFVTRDFEKVDAYVYQAKTFLQGKRLYQEIKRNVFFVLLGYLKAQLILMSLTFVISFIGLSILKVEYAVLLALIVAFVDALPMFGPAIVYVPWIIARALLGNLTGAIALSVLYLVATLTRQTLEPKIVSSQIGVHPILTLSSMYAGIKLFGVFGIILGPLSLIIILKSYETLTLS